MTTFQRLWRNLIGRKDEKTAVLPNVESQSEATAQIINIDLEIAPNDPLIAFAQNNRGVIEVERLNLISPALHQLREAGIQLILPLVSQSELIGLVSLGQRMSDQEYSSDDRKFLVDLGIQAAPALRVAQLVRQQQLEFAERQRIEQELKVARLIQQTLLPQALPKIEGYQLTAYYQPAREVGGDFYDFIYFEDGKIGLIVADVTDKGVPAALVMATTRTLLRAAAERLADPGAVLAWTNDVLVAEIPPRMFVTCFYAVLDPATGHFCYANAGHDVAYRYTAAGVVELRATGMPLGLMPGMRYEAKETTLDGGDYVLMYSDGLVEAHDPHGEMFGFPRLQTMLGMHDDGATLNDFLLDQLAGFTGPSWEQEDDVTLVVLQRHKPAAKLSKGVVFEVLSALGNERLAMVRVAEIVQDVGLPANRLEKLKTAVAEATMNAMEHGNQYDASIPVKIAVALEETAVLHMHGEINAAADAALTAAYSEAEQQQPTAVTLDFKGVDYINSTGIALIVGLLARARQAQRPLTAVGLSDHYREIFTITRLSDFMEIL